MKYRSAFHSRVRITAAAAALLLGAAVPVPAFAEGPGAMHTEEEMVHLSDNNLEWYEIDGLISEYNPTVVKNRNEFNTDKRRTMDAQEVTDYLLTEADRMDSLSDSFADTAAVMAANYRNQANSLRLQAESNVTDSEVIRLQYDLIEKQTAAAARTAFLDYYSGLYEKEYADANVAYLERLYQSAATKKNVGVGTEIELLTAQENLDNARAGRLSTESAIGSSRNSVLVMCGWAFDSAGVIGPLPEMTPEAAMAVSYDADLAAAQERNLTLQIDRIKLRNAQTGNYTTLIVEQNQNQLNTDTNTFGVNFKGAYDKLVNAVTAYNNAVSDKAAADLNLATADRQLSLGTISPIDHAKAQNAQKASELALRKAYIGMIAARSAYDDAVNGNI